MKFSPQSFVFLAQLFLCYGVCEMSFDKFGWINLKQFFSAFWVSRSNSARFSRRDRSQEIGVEKLGLTS
ncbi:unnamed protein product [Citrullus colocynthis]|uniref:Secreted protein n=1 Tax=Citrullus colocynthis TaxID=252529 RepID=A0ABP0Z412_9ROSI